MIGRASCRTTHVLLAVLFTGCSATAPTSEKSRPVPPTTLTDAGRERAIDATMTLSGNRESDRQRTTQIVTPNQPDHIPREVGDTPVATVERLVAAGKA